MNKNKFYPDVKSTVSFPAIEEEVLKYWQENNIFNKSVETRKAKIGNQNNEFIFYDGPPFANGLPHYGHLLTGFIKDVFARYQTTKGKKVERRFGWDCHGLPAEMGAEKELGFSGRIAISEYGIDKFNNHCRLSVMKYSSDWEKYVNRQARWVDFNNSYKTMDKNYMESVLWAFKELFNKGLIYESMRVMPYSWACETPLSNFETRLDNSYRQRTDKAVTVSFVLSDKPQNAPEGFREYRILAWTTTPWTLPSNLALAVNSDFNYAFVPNGDICYIIASFAVNHYAKELNIEKDKTDFKTVKGKELAGLKYKPIFDYFKNHPNSFRILTGDFVVEGDGTGVVHMAPGFGEDDQILCQQEGIELVCPVDNAGKFTAEISDFADMQVFEATDPIIIKLKNQGNWLKTEQYIHNYPHCWRTDTPLIYKAVPSWYVKVTEFKDRMVELNQQINWIPDNVKDGLFGKWLENARDWSISRNRFWGTPIPVWRSNDSKYPRIDVYGSCAELEKHYPFENKEWFESHFPADFIVEYSAQTRGWFYTLMVLSTALFDRPPFLNCICHGVILDSTGQKLSKRLNNYADPLELFDKYGADALRVTMLSSNVVKGQELLIDKDGKMVFDALRLFIKPIWNAYHFFCLYANLDGIKARYDISSSNILDQYILSKLKITVRRIDNSMNQFDTVEAYAAITDFFEVLNNWYIRRSRSRFWKTEQDADKLSAYNTLYTCLEVMMKAMSSLLPLISENIYRSLTSGTSVHLEIFPNVEDIKIEENLVKVMDQILDICNAALFIRSEENTRIRQPLSKLLVHLEGIDEGTYDNYIKQFEDLIKDEVNVKSIIYQEDVKEYADLKLSINFPLLGKRLPEKMKEIIAAARAGNWHEASGKLFVSGIELLPEEYTLAMEPKKGIKGVKALSNSIGLVKLDLEITKGLEEEGIARDLVRFIQQTRKEAGFEVSDRIKLNIKSDTNLEPVLANYGAFITEQTLSEIRKDFKPEYIADIELDNQIVSIEVAKLR